VLHSRRADKPSAATWTDRRRACGPGPQAWYDGGMQHLLKLGPVVLEGLTTNVYLRVDEGGDVGPPSFAQDDLEGLKELMANERPERLLCDPTLSEAAATLGLTVQATPPRPLQSRAAIAVFMAWGQRGVANAGSDMALLFMQSATELWQGHPWVYWGDRQPLDVEFSGALSGSYEGVVFASKEQGYGLALYEERGAVRRLIALQEAGAAEEARALPAIAVMLDDKPAYAVEALETAGRVPRLPIPLKTGPAGLAVPSTIECLGLVAALRAVASLSDKVLHGSCDTSARGVEVSVQVTAPPARVRN
jgi:hypothetical protein